MDNLREAYSTILNEVQTGIVVLNQWEQVLDLNPAAENILFVEKDQALNQYFASIFEDWNRIKTLCIRTKYNYIRKSSENTDGFLITCFPFGEEKTASAGGVILLSAIPDTGSENCNTELSRLHTELAEMNLSLRSQVRERTREVEALLVQRDHFIGQLGHDLRTPLIPLVGLIPFLIEQEKDPGIVKLLSQMKTSIDVMQHTVEKLIDLARLNSIYFVTDQKSYDLADLVASVMNEFTTEADNSNIEIIVEIPPGIILKLSPVHAHEIMRHLLSNAIKYNNSGGTIHIGAEINENCVTIIIKDSGIGIDQEDIPRIFEEFYRADQSRNNLEAKGLGLAIVRRMVVLNEGKIWVESEGLGKGSTFFVRFPQGDHQTWLVS